MGKRIHLSILICVLAVVAFATGCGGGAGFSSPSSNNLAAPNSGTSGSSSSGSAGSSSPAVAAFDAYPSSANVSANMNNSPWTSCNCGGTGATPSAESLTQTGGHANVSVSGNGGGVSGWLWYSNLASNNANNWIMQYDITPTQLAGAAALEFDGNQTGSLGDFVFGTECNFGYNPTGKTVWRFWTQSGGSQTWGTTNFACPITQVNHTYRVQTHFMASSGQYEVKRVKVTDLTAGAVVQDQSNLGTFSSVGSHGDSVDIQLDAAGGSTISAEYSNITVVRWFE